MSSSCSTISMESLPKIHHSRLFFNHRHFSSPTPFPNPTSFRFLPPHPFSSSPLTLSSIKTSSSSSPSPLPSPSPKDPPDSQKPQNIFSRLLQTLNPFSSPLFEPIYVVIAAITFILMRIQFNPAATTATTSPLPPPPAESATVASENLSDKAIEEEPINIPDDADSLRSYVEVNVRARKLNEAIKGVDRLIELKPNEFDLHLLKAHLHSHNGEPKLAKNAFEITLKLEPFNAEAYRGLLMATSELNESMDGLLKRIEEVVKFYEEEKRDLEAREYKLLMAQAKVMDEDYSGALKVYEEIVKEEPRDFRPYLCQGVVYTLLRKNDEAEKQFEEYRKLVPENHPYREFFEGNTKIFSQKIEKGGIAAKSSEE